MVPARVTSVLILLAAAACGASGGPSSGPSGPTPTPATSPVAFPTPTLPPAIAQVVDVHDQLVWRIASAGNTIWVEGESRTHEPGSGMLHQLDGATGELLRSIPGSVPFVDGDTLWYSRADDLVEADAQTGEERATYQPPVLGTMVHDGILWATDEEKGILARVDLKNEEVTGQLKLPDGEPKQLAFWEGAVWVVIDGSDVVLRVDPRTMTVTDEVPAGLMPHSLAAGFGALWVIEHGTTEVVRLQPNGEVSASISGPGLTVAITVARGYVWATGPHTIAKIDPATNEIVNEIEIGYSDYYGMTFSQGSLWITTGKEG
jgi:hypothetical protein